MSLRTFHSMFQKTISSIAGKIGDKEMMFLSSDKKVFKFWHHCICQEPIVITQIIGDISNLIDKPLICAKEIALNSLNYKKYCVIPTEGRNFAFKFATTKGQVIILWSGKNQKCSEAISFEVDTYKRCFL